MRPIGVRSRGAASSSGGTTTFRAEIPKDGGETHLEAGAISSAAVEIPPEFPPKWDLGDDLPPSVSEADLLILLNKARNKRVRADTPNAKDACMGRAFPIEAPLLPVPAFDADVLLPPVSKIGFLTSPIGCHAPWSMWPRLLLSARAPSSGRGARSNRRGWTIGRWCRTCGAASLDRPRRRKRLRSTQPRSHWTVSSLARSQQHERNLKEFEADALIHQSRIEALENEIKQAVKPKEEARRKKQRTLTSSKASY